MKKLLWIGLAFLVVLVGCDLVSRDFYRAADDFPEEGKGMLVLVLDTSEIPTKTLDPTDTDADVLDVDSYTVVGTHQILGGDLGFSGYPNVALADLTDGVFTINNLTPGDWDITVTAYNSTPTAIGVSELQTIKILPNTGVVDSIQVVPLPGTGELHLRILWVQNSVPGPRVDAMLTPVTAVGFGDPDIGSVNDGFVFAPANEANYDNAAIPPGYYVLSLELFANAGTAEEEKIIGETKSARVVSSIPTNGFWDLTNEDGWLDLTIDLDLKNPIVIAITAVANSTYPTLTDVTATLQSDPSVRYDYAWYVDGGVSPVQQVTKTGGADDTDDTYILDPSSYASGGHNLSVVVTAGDATMTVIDSVSSTTYTFIGTAP